MRALLADIGELAETELVELRADVNVMGAVRQLIELPSFENFSQTLNEIRKGEAFSTDGEEAIKQLLSVFRSEDKSEVVDTFLNEFLKKTDVATPEVSEVEGLSVDFARAQAHARRLKQ